MTKLPISDKQIKLIMGAYDASFTEAVEILCETQDYNVDEVMETLADEARTEDAEAEFQFENQAENAWLRHAEYDAESQMDLEYQIWL